MRDSDRGDGAVFIATFVIVLILLAGGGLYVVWMRQQAIRARQEAMMQRDLAEAEARLATQRMMAEAEAAAQENAEDFLQAQAAESTNTETSNASSTTHDEELRSFMENLSGAWNRAALDELMTCYEASDQLVVIWEGTTIRTGEAFRKHIEALGGFGQEMVVGDVQVTTLGADAALISSQWRRSEDDSGSAQTVIQTVRKSDGRWQIIQESRAPKSEDPKVDALEVDEPESDESGSGATDANASEPAEAG